jgi:Na+/glutamate symporter
MLPVEKFSSGSIQNLLLILSLIGILLFVAVILRLKINFLRRAFIPASLIAGLIGLALGPYALGLFPGEIRSSMAALPSTLIVIVFATMLIGEKHTNLKEAFKQCAPVFFQGYMYSFAQLGFTCLLTALIFTPVFGTNPLFGTVVEIGFLGGHGTAGGMSGIFTSLGWPAGSDVGQTTATIGLIAGIFGGLILINIGVKKKYTKFLVAADNLNIGQDVYTGDNKKPSSYNTISRDIVECFAFHMGMIGVAVWIGYAIVFAVQKTFGFKLPLFPFAMIGGWLLNMVLQRTPFGALIDRPTLMRIQGLSMDFLIVAAVASVSIPVVVEYMGPLLISCAVCLTVTVWIFWWISPRIFKDNWFENGILRYGAATGVAAIGFLLLRTVDPEMKSDALKLYALNAPFSSPFVGGGLITSAYPGLIIMFGALECGVFFIGLFLSLILICRVSGIWNKAPKFKQRGNMVPAPAD